MNRAAKFKPNTTSGAPRYNHRAKIEAMYKSGDWIEYSRKFLSYNPKCYSCGNKSEATDHLTPHKGDENLFWKLDNMIPLCHKCHNTITARFDGKLVPDPIGKLKWIARNRAINTLAFKVKVVPR